MLNFNSIKWNPIKKWVKDSRFFSKEDVQMANKHIKICSMLLSLRKCKLYQGYGTAHLLEWLSSKQCHSMFLCRKELSLAAMEMQIAEPLYCTGRQHANFL